MLTRSIGSVFLASALYALCFQTAHAQSIPAQAVVTSGNSVVQSGNALVYTIGEITVESMVAGGHSIGQGMLHASTQSIVTALDDNSHGVTANVYPNPVSDLLHITVSNTGDMGTQVDVFDISGKEVYRGFFSSGATLISVNAANWQSGVYVLSVSDGSTCKRFKIAKP